jgi:hypothetical protein
MYLDKRADVDRYAEAMDHIVATSYTPEQTKELIRTIIVDMEGSLCQRPPTG